MNGVIVVTGASGFTGRYVLRQLAAQNCAVLPLSASGRDGRRCDITDKASIRAALADVTIAGVIHLAAESFIAEPDQSRFYRINTIGTLNLIEVLAELGATPAKVVVASSANVYGRNAGRATDETVIPSPVNHYAASKLAMEHLLQNWYADFPLLVTRPFNYTGPGQSDRFLVPKIVRHFRERLPVIELGNIDIERDYSSVVDIAACYVNLLRSPLHSTVVNLCSGTALGIRELLGRLTALSGHHIEVRRNPAFVRRDDIAHLSGSNARLQEATGFVPAFTDELLVQMLEEPAVV